MVLFSTFTPFTMASHLLMQTLIHTPKQIHTPKLEMTGGSNPSRQTGEVKLLLYQAGDQQACSQDPGLHNPTRASENCQRKCFKNKRCIIKTGGSLFHPLPHQFQASLLRLLPPAPPPPPHLPMQFPCTVAMNKACEVYDKAYPLCPVTYH